MEYQIYMSTFRTWTFPYNIMLPIKLANCKLYLLSVVVGAFCFLFWEGGGRKIIFQAPDETYVHTRCVYYMYNSHSWTKQCDDGDPRCWCSKGTTKDGIKCKNGFTERWRHEGSPGEDYSVRYSCDRHGYGHYNALVGHQGRVIVVKVLLSTTDMTLQIKH